MPRGKLRVQSVCDLFDAGSANRETKLRDPPTQELRALVFPLQRSVHDEHGGKARTEPSEMKCAADIRGAWIMVATKGSGGHNLFLLDLIVRAGSPYICGKSWRRRRLPSARNHDPNGLFILQLRVLLHIDNDAVLRSAPGTVGGTHA